MEEEKYDEILKYLTEQTYPARLDSKQAKRSFRPTCEVYRIYEGRLCYVCKRKSTDERRRSVMYSNCCSWEGGDGESV